MTISWMKKKKIRKLSSKKIISKNTHGSGCTFSSALALNLARGFSLSKSILLSKQLTKKYISNAPELNLDYGPLGHWL